MIRGDKHLTPAIDFTGTKTEIEATPSPIEGMTALATDNPSAPIGKYLGGAWVWLGGSGGGDVVSPSGSVNGNFSIFDGVTGKIILDSGINHLLFTDAKDPTGWVAPDDITIEYDKTARTITLTGTLDYYWRGRKYSLESPWTSAAHTDAAGNYYLYSDDGATFGWSTSAWVFSDIMVAKAVYTAADKFALRETHGLMPWQVHEELHETISAFRESGGGLTPDTYVVNTPTDAANSPGFDAAEIQDEDLHTSIPAWAEGTYTTMRIGASSVATFDTAATLPFRYGASYLYYNTPTTGAETAASNNRYLNVYQIIVPAAADADSQKYRMLMLQPQAQYTSLAAALAEDPRQLVLGDLLTSAPEFVIYARITYVTASGDANNGKCRIATGGITYLAGTKLSQVSVSGFVGSTAENISFIPAGSIAATNVQAAIEELDAEKVPTSRTITATAPLTIGGGASADLSADRTIAVSAATTSAAGVVELATSAEMTTGTDTERAVTPDALRGSDYGKRVGTVSVIDAATTITTGDGKRSFFIPAEFDGWKIVALHASLVTASTSGAPIIQVRNVTDSVDVLSTRITIDANEKTSYTAATAPVINTSNNTVATGDEIAIDIDGAGTGAKGLDVIVTLQKAGA